MRSWSQLESDFRALRGSGFDARLDHQDGAAGEHWRIAATSSSQDSSRFEALARMGGDKLLEVPTAVEWPEVGEESDSVIRWYRALRHLPGVYRAEMYGIQKDDEGNDCGVIHLARIQNVYETSAILCATLEALATAPRRRAELLCTVPRYNGPCQHWRSAQFLLSSEEPNYAKAAHEAVSAVEGLCRIILDQPSITLGDALKILKQRGLLHPAFAKSIEGLWGFASTEPGVRHGAATLSAVKPHDAQYVVEACDAALVLLLALDGG
jgi:hypothetical protein